MAWLLAGIVLLGGLWSTRFAVTAEHDASAQEDHARLAGLARRQVELLASAVREDVAMLQATAAFQAINSDDFAGFEAFTDRLPLEDHPGLSYIAYVVPIAPAQVPTLEAARRGDGQPEFTVQPGPLDRRYHVVLFGGPNPGPPPGVDLGQIGLLACALDRAADQGTAFVTEPFVRVQDRVLPLAEQLPSIALLYVPVFAPGEPIGTVQQRARRPARLDDVVDPGAGAAR